MDEVRGVGEGIDEKQRGEARYIAPGRLEELEFLSSHFNQLSTSSSLWLHSPDFVRMGFDRSRRLECVTETALSSFRPRPAGCRAEVSLPPAPHSRARRRTHLWLEHDA